MNKIFTLTSMLAFLWHSPQCDAGTLEQMVNGAMRNPSRTLGVAMLFGITGGFAIYEGLRSSRNYDPEKRDTIISAAAGSLIFVVAAAALSYRLRIPTPSVFQRLLTYGKFWTKLLLRSLCKYKLVGGHKVQ
jgi:hypothetical protein